MKARNLTLTVMMALAATPAAASDEPERTDDETSLTIHVGLMGTQLRDHNVSPRRHVGRSWRVGAGIETWTGRKIDRLTVDYSQGDLGDPTRWGLAQDWTLHPRVASWGAGSLYVGGALRTAFNARDGLVHSWDLTCAVEPGVTWRQRVSDQLWVEGTASTPLVGFLLRPGFASPLPGRSLDFGDAQLAAPHNHQGALISSALFWNRTSGSDLRVTLAYELDRVTTPQLLTRASLRADVAFYWRF